MLSIGVFCTTHVILCTTTPVHYENTTATLTTFLLTEMACSTASTGRQQYTEIETKSLNEIHETLLCLEDIKCESLLYLHRIQTTYTTLDTRSLSLRPRSHVLARPPHLAHAQIARSQTNYM